jgi:3-(3-hydroxy-phenyl)propionate hydroxylase
MNANASTMMAGYELPTYSFRSPPELTGGRSARYPVVIVGAGLAGLTAACDLATRGVESVVLDEDDTIGVRGLASRGICYAQKSLEIFDRLGIYERISAKGLQWSTGKTLAGRDVVYSFDLALDSVSKQPPFINIQQFYIEWFLVDRIQALGRTDLRWRSKVTGVSEAGEGVRLQVQTPLGEYHLEAQWVLDASGVNSPIREAFALPANAARGQDRWCISDVRFKKPWPIERWTYVEAPFNQNRAVWQHPMADEVWRLDYQMEANADPDEVSRPEVVLSRLKDQLGPDTEFELVWVGPYAYRTQILDEFRRGRVFFLGDAAHVMSPFGARGGNSAIQDAENVAWKLKLVLENKAPEALLDSYNAERQPAARHNIKVTSRTTRFLSPESAAERILRNAVLSLAREYPFARALVNTGRMSSPFAYQSSPLVSDGGEHVQNVPIGLPDGAAGHLLDLFAGDAVFLGVYFVTGETDGRDVRDIAALQQDGLPLKLFMCGAGTGLAKIEDQEGKLQRALRAQPGDFHLIRPDLHLAARIAAPSAAKIRNALDGALGKKP